MVLVKILENRRVIRLFGSALIASPFINTAISMALVPFAGSSRWNIKFFWHVLSSTSWLDLTLYFLSIMIGLIMLKGSTAAWKAVLFLMGTFVASQAMGLSQNLKISCVYGLLFLINMSIFIFIADQLVWKVEVKFKKPLTPNKARAKVLVHFSGRGPWAQLVAITKKGIQVRSINSPPADIENRMVEISLKTGPTLKLKLVSQKENNFFFEYTNLKPEEIQSLNQWIKNRAA